MRAWPSLPCSFLRETCFETRLHVVPKRLPRDLSQVGGPPGESPRALPEEGVGRAFLCDGRRFPLGRRGVRGLPPEGTGRTMSSSSWEWSREASCFHDPGLLVMRPKR